jgi:hypothetical protein
MDNLLMIKRISPRISGKNLPYQNNPGSSNPPLKSFDLEQYDLYHPSTNSQASKKATRNNA